jgi:predicted pyridoxine 5'-phosphate oxidase superfamily flavin-nucleotide-binding protein
VKLTADMQRVIMQQRLGFVATVTPDGAPNLSPKGTTIVWDDEHLMFADVASPNTVANLKSNPRVEINVVDPIVRKGYRFRGTGTVHGNGDLYERGIARLRDAGSTLPQERIRAIVIVEVHNAAELISPAYDLGATETEVADRWMRHFRSLR